MDKRTWPTGVRPSGRGIRIKIWKDGALYYAETIEGDPYKQVDLAAAVRRRDSLQSRLKLGLSLKEEEQGKKELFTELAQDYLNSMQVKRSTASDYLRILNHYWIPRFGNRLKDEITTRMIKSALGELTISAKTKRNILIPLRGVFDHGDVTPNPVGALAKKGVKREQKAKIDRYTPDQRKRLVEALKGQDQVYFAVLFGCGLRPGEALGLTWSDYKDGHLSVTKQITRRRMEPTTKTYMERNVYVPMWTRGYLDGHTTRFKKGHIFLNTKGGPYLDTDVFNGAWSAAHSALKIPYKIPYVCRHTRAAEMLSTGVDPAEAAKQMGHSLEMFFRTYAEWIAEYSENKDLSRFEGSTDKIPTKGIV